MGKGGYLGGSTLIRPGSDWFSGISQHSPAKKKKATSTARGAKNTSGDNSLGDVRLAHIHAVIHAGLTKQPIPQPPKRLRLKLQTEIDQAGGPIAWVRKQSQYEKILEKKRKKLQKKELSSPSADSSVLKQGPSPADDPAINTQVDLRKAETDRLKLERRRLHDALEDAQRIIANCLNEIRRVDTELAEWEEKG